jgi:hypothetical protein
LPFARYFRKLTTLLIPIAEVFARVSAAREDAFRHPRPPILGFVALTDRSVADDAFFMFSVFCGLSELNSPSLNIGV